MNQPIRQSHRHRTCDELGVCKARIPACNGCTVKCIPSVNTDPSPTAPSSLVEDAAIWIAITAVRLATVAVAFGVAGYLWGQP